MSDGPCSRVRNGIQFVVDRQRLLANPCHRIGTGPTAKNPFNSHRSGNGLLPGFYQVVSSERAIRRQDP